MVSRVEQTLICKATFSANLPANSIVPVNFIIDPQKGDEPVLTPAMNESIVIDDIYVTTSPGVDCIVQLIKNEYETICVTDPLSTLSVTNPARPRYAKKVINPLERLSAKAINLSAVGSTAVTVTFYMKIVRFRP
ncbi:MAG: hypothetical protein QW607_05690 [Desulfurococcaceae archaeon]